MPTSISNSVDFAALGLGAPPAVQARKELGQEDFLQLMIAQLENQDPFKPLESGEFLGQRAQFGTVGGLNDLNKKFESLAGSLVSDQALQATNLVGRSVLIESSTAVLDDSGAVLGAIELGTGTSAVQIQISDANGEPIRQIDLGSQSAGRVEFRWRGETDAGVAAPPGSYSVTAQYFERNQMNGAPVLVNARVESVIFGSGGVEVKLSGLGQVPFSLVKEIS
jgi:flagellar basal-body rod modification protein FlgD